MRVKRCIALLLLAVYLLATGGRACAALTCDCVAMHGHAAHLCCDHCAEHAAPDGLPLWKAVCCDDRHSTRIDLYTAADDDSRVVRVAVCDLLAALVADECLCPLCRPAGMQPAERPSPPESGPELPACGLRAPPVLS